MGHSALDEPFNLGLYSIRSPDRSSLRVGSFWRRKRQATIDNEPQTKLPSDCENTEPDCEYSSSKPLDLVKRQRTVTSNSLTDHRTQTTSNTSASSVKSATNGQEVESQTTILDVGLWDSIAISDSQKTLVSNSRSHESECPHTQHVPPHPSPTPLKSQASQKTESTEAICVDVAPNFFDSTTEDFSSLTDTEILSSKETDTIANSSAQCAVKTYPKQRPYAEILSHVRFVLSGYENPRRSRIKELAIRMGAKYRAKWDRTCTHLICAFKHTPKYIEVMFKQGRVVREHWIQECSKQRQLLDWRNYKLGKYPYPDSEDDDDE